MQGEKTDKIATHNYVDVDDQRHILQDDAQFLTKVFFFGSLIACRAVNFNGRYLWA